MDENKEIINELKKLNTNLETNNKTLFLVLKELKTLSKREQPKLEVPEQLVTLLTKVINKKETVVRNELVQRKTPSINNTKPKSVSRLTTPPPVLNRAVKNSPPAQDLTKLENQYRQHLGQPPVNNHVSSTQQPLNTGDRQNTKYGPVSGLDDVNWLGPNYPEQ